MCGLVDLQFIMHAFIFTNQDSSLTCHGWHVYFKKSASIFKFQSLEFFHNQLANRIETNILRYTTSSLNIQP